MRNSQSSFFLLPNVHSSIWLMKETHFCSVVIWIFYLRLECVFCILFNTSFLWQEFVQELIRRVCNYILNFANNEAILNFLTRLLTPLWMQFITDTFTFLQISQTDDLYKEYCKYFTQFITHFFHDNNKLIWETFRIPLKWNTC